jgi:cytochrome c553
MILEKKERPICENCNKNVCRIYAKSKLGFDKYAKICDTCHKIRYNQSKGGRKIGYRLYKKDICEQCGFIPIHKCQLDVDHIDGNKNNEEIINLQTLCANCHRLKTYKQKNFIPYSSAPSSLAKVESYFSMFF